MIIGKDFEDMFCKDKQIMLVWQQIFGKKFFHSLGEILSIHRNRFGELLLYCEFFADGELCQR